MLKDFRVTAEECLDETERADRPRVMVTPDEEIDACGEQSPGQKKLRPSPEWRRQGLAQLAETDDEDQHTSEMVVKLRIGHALG